MKIIKRGKFIYFEDYNEREIKLIDYLLSFKEYNYAIKKNITHRFLFVKEKQAYTYFGYKDYLIENLQELDVNVEFINEDNISKPEIDLDKIRQLGEYTLRDYQTLAVVKSLYHRFGTVISATGSGKSLMMGALLKYLDLPSLTIVPTVQLAEQFYENLLKYGFDKSEISVLKSSNPKVRKYNIAVINSIVNLIKANPDLFNDIKVLLFDEAQYRQAKSYRFVDEFFTDKVSYSLGFTGTVYRFSKKVEQKKKLEDWISYGFTGRNPIVNIDYKFLLKKSVLSQPYIYIDTINSPQVHYKSWQGAYKNLIIKNKNRNQKIAQWIEYFYNKGLFPSLVLTDTIQHIENMFEFLPEELKHESIAILGNKTVLKYEYGQLNSVKLFSYNDIIEKIRNNEYKIVFGSPALKQGTDIPEIKSMILAYTGKSEVAVLQRIGRGLRKTEDKDKVFIVDFYDNTHPFLQSHSKARIEMYNQNEFPLFFSYKNEEDKFKNLIKKEFDKFTKV